MSILVDRHPYFHKFKYTCIPLYACIDKKKGAYPKRKNKQEQENKTNLPTRNQKKYNKIDKEKLTSLSLCNAAKILTGRDIRAKVQIISFLIISTCTLIAALSSSTQV